MISLPGADSLIHYDVLLELLELLELLLLELLDTELTELTLEAELELGLEELDSDELELDGELDD